MQKLDIGGRGYRNAQAAATLTFTPLFDRSAIVTELEITNPSAVDNWTVIVGGREVMRVRIDTIGNQQPFGVQQVLTAPVAGSQVRPVNLFDYMSRNSGVRLDIPVPNGLSMVVASVGGATADIQIEFREVDVNDVPVTLPNHPLGKEFIVPIWGFLAVAATTVGPLSFDTQVAPPWFPNFFTGAEFPVNFTAKVLALFVEGEGRNTFSGAANHQSVTQFLEITKNGQLLATRDPNTGIPVRGIGSAAGSANTVLGSESSLFPPVQSSWGQFGDFLDPPLQYKGGDSILWQWLLSGDVTGGADYSHAYVVAVVDLQLQ